jgi:DNA-binding transcriptional LysR family regulator
MGYSFLNMELRHFRYFVAGAEAENVSRAARKFFAPLRWRV